MAKLLMLLSLLLVPLVVRAGGKKKDASCANTRGIVKKVHEEKVEAADLQEYLGCLKTGKKNMVPAVVKFITTAAKDAGAGDEVSKNCNQLIENEENGCDENYGPQLKGLTGEEAEITVGDLCAQTCSRKKHKHGGGEKKDMSCARTHGIVKKIRKEKVEAADLEKYLTCLKDHNKNMVPAVVKVITTAAKDAGAGDKVSKNCRELIENEENGCDQNYGPQLKGLTGEEAEVTVGDLCVKRCSKNDEEVAEKFQLFAMPLHTMSSMSVGAAAAAVAATGLASVAFVARAARRAAPLLVTVAGDQLLETGLE